MPKLQSKWGELRWLVARGMVCEHNCWGRHSRLLSKGFTRRHSADVPHPWRGARCCGGSRECARRLEQAKQNILEAQQKQKTTTTASMLSQSYCRWISLCWKRISPARRPRRQVEGVLFGAVLYHQGSPRWNVRACWALKLTQNCTSYICAHLKPYTATEFSPDLQPPQSPSPHLPSPDPSLHPYMFQAQIRQIRILSCHPSICRAHTPRIPMNIKWYR